MILNRIDVIANAIGLTDNKLKGIEIGCLSGDFAAGILSKFKNLYLTSIDPIPKYDEIYKNINKGDTSSEPKFKILKCTSDEAIYYLDREYDFVFIDGDHSYEQTRKDILNYWKIIKKGGVLSGHNYEENEGAHHGVAEAVHEIFGKGNFNVGADVTWWKYV